MDCCSWEGVTCDGKSGEDPCPCPLLFVFDLSFKGLSVEHNGNVISDEVHMPICRGEPIKLVSKYQLGMDRLLSSSWTVSCARHGPWNLVGPLSPYGLQGHWFGLSEH
ncbi:hypothetical protein F2Q68_00006716 [Brassica cretica]|uniref:Uncharacterized protein n=1 Tax=Brassica cretica TaxID=69181 RepID=A0A8S9JJ83_BRACR|nr:hypothetical protein F2Q68_00006716 [Brassica cretica]